MTHAHIPVLLTEVLDGMRLQPGATVLDGTVGLGGHASQICTQIGETGTLVAIDRDEANLLQAKKALSGCRVVSLLGSYADAATLLLEVGVTSLSAALLDLGYSSVHVDDATRGFSFQQEGPLDMRYNRTEGETAADLVNTLSVDDLARIFRVYGEERSARSIAEAIVHARSATPFTTTTQLAELVSQVSPRSRGQKIHPATRVFQALRIAVNDELGHLERGLDAIVSLLEPGGRLAVISFHSLEDRVVKRFIDQHDRLFKVNKKVITASGEEVKHSPRSRSAKLRIAEVYDETSKATTHGAIQGEGAPQHPYP